VTFLVTFDLINCLRVFQLSTANKTKLCHYTVYALARVT